MGEAPRVICETGSFYPSDAEIPEFLHFEIDGKDPQLFRFSFETTLDASTVTSVSGKGMKKMACTPEYLKKLPHELVCECKGIAMSDEKLSKIAILRDETDRLTPDGIALNSQGIYEVLEVKTSKTYHGVKNIFESARNKYLRALETRVKENNIVFSILVVCPTGIYTNLLLTKVEIDNLVSHYLLGNVLQEQAKALGWNPDEMFTEEDNFVKLFDKIMLDDYSVNCRGEAEPLHITKKMKQDWEDIPFLNATQIFDINLHRNRPRWTKLIQMAAKEDCPMETFIRQQAEFERSLPVNFTDQLTTVIHLPFITVEKSRIISEGWREEELPKIDINVDTPYGKLWQEAILACLADEDRFTDIMGEDAERQIRNKGFWEADPESVSKSKRFVVDLKLNSEQRTEFALRGVQAKGMKKDVDLVLKREESKKNFSMDCETGDIELSFENLNHWLGPHCQFIHPSEQRIAGLVAKALHASGEKTAPESELFIRGFLGTRCGLALTFLHEIVAEVNYTRLKNVKKDCFVFKRLPNYEAYVILKPTTSDKHVFFSLLIPKSKVASQLPISERFLDLGNCFCTKFVSLDRHKISHLLYCHLKMASMFAFWHHQFGTPQLNLLAEYNSRVNDHFWMCMLVYLEDKEKTSTALQLIRYSYMEMVKGGILMPQPGKIFSKLDPILRSRLLVFCLKNFCHSFKEMLLNPPLVGEDSSEMEISEDAVSRLLSWVDLKPLSNYEQALNLSYLGVLHNKEEGDLISGYLKIFDKVISQELKMEAADITKMTVSMEVDAAKLKDHEFSAIAIKSFAATAKKVISKKRGPYDIWMRGALARNLLRRTFEELATSKASASETPEDPPEEDEEEVEFYKMLNKWKAGKLKTKPKPSLKCIENIYYLLKSLDANDSKVFKHFETILAEVEASGGLTVKLFKKLQIGGTREIFILPIKSRIVVNFLETVCRTICDELPCEMLTKGDQKIMRSDAHYKRRSTMGIYSNTVTVISSDDAATWAQRFVMPAFGVMLSVLVPKPFLDPCLRVLNLITSKRLVLPHELLRLFSSYKTQSCFNDNTTRLKREYLEPEFEKTSGERRMLVQSGSNLMSNRSNMMQGILHYTSSLLHSCYMTALVCYSELKLNMTTKKNGVIRAIATGKVSSDDSSFIISLAHESSAPPSAKTLCVVGGTFFSLLKSACYPLICSKQSTEKSSVAGTNLIEEFNSLWYFRNTLLTPGIKFVAASIRTHVTEQFETRLHVMAGLRSQVLENTGSIFLTSVIQYCQMRAHYLSLGSSSNPLFSMYANLLLEASHPALGFFVLEPSLSTGLLGYRYALYLLMKNDSNVSKISHFFFSSSMMAMTETAGSSTSIALTQGSRDRFNKMMKRMSIDRPSILDHFDDHPEELFDRPDSKEALMNAIALKATTPSMSNAFEFLTDSKQHAASSYILQCPCVTLTTRTVALKPDDRTKLEQLYEHKKVSLCGMVLHYAKMAKDPDAEVLSRGEFNMLFPNLFLYRQIDQFLVEARESLREIATREKKSYVIFSVPKFGVNFLASPIASIRNRWFGRTVKYSEYEINQTWTIMKDLFDWLRPNFTDSLISSSLGSAVAMFQFFTSLPLNSSSVRILTAASKKTSTFRTLKELICKAQWPKIVLKPLTDSGESICYEERPFLLPTPSETLMFERTVHERSALREENISYVKKQNANVVATALWYEASLPVIFGCEKNYELTHTESRVKRIFNDCLDIVPQQKLTKSDAHTFLTPRDSTLAVMQYVIKKGKGSAVDVSNVLACTKRGLVGHFATKATYDENIKIYKGEAIFRGTYNDVPFELHSYDEKSLKLVVVSKKFLARLALGFYRTMEELRCNKLATEHEVKRSTSNPHPEYFDPKSGALSHVWKTGYIVIEENSRLPIGRSLGSNVIFKEGKINEETKEKDRVIRLIDRGKPLKGPHMAGSYHAREKFRRGHTVLHFFPSRPTSIETGVQGNRLNPFSIAGKASHGIRYNPMDVYVSGVSPNASGMMRYLKSALSNEHNGLEKLYPGVTEWFRETLKERAGFVLGLFPTSALLSSYLASAEYADTTDALDVEDDAQETNFDELFGDDSSELDFSLDDCEDLLATEHEAEGIAPCLSNAMSEDITGTWYARTVPDLEVDLLTEFSEFRPMSNYSSKDNPNRLHPMWDKFLEELKKNSNSETRSKAFNGRCKPGSAEIVELVARLYCEKGKDHLITEENLEPKNSGLDEDFEV